VDGLAISLKRERAMPDHPSPSPSAPAASPFLPTASSLFLLFLLSVSSLPGISAAVSSVEARQGPCVAVGTWNFASLAVEKAGRILAAGGSAVDAAEAGVNALELDASEQTYVGYGGLPNAEGDMEFDAGIMDGRGCRYGAVMALKGIKRAVSVARFLASAHNSPHCARPCHLPPTFPSPTLFPITSFPEAHAGRNYDCKRCPRH